MPRVARQLELFCVPVRLNRTFLFRRVLIGRNFRHISFRLYLGHGRHDFWFFLGSSFIASTFWFDEEQSFGKPKRSPPQWSEWRAICSSLLASDKLDRRFG
jgi:hypothetical protein